MSGLNKVMIIGNLGGDPEIRYTQAGQAVCNFNIATSETFEKNGEKVEKTEWHRIVVWGKTAENCGEYLRKGSKAYVEGKLQTRQWDDREGVTRYTTEIVALAVQFLTPRNEGQQPAPQQQQQRRQAPPAQQQQRRGGPAQHEQGPPPGYGDDDIPF